MVFRKRKIDKKVNYAVVGINNGIGVTHTCLMIANYLSSREGYKVTYVEMSEVSSLLGVVKGEAVQVHDTVGYRYKNVDYVFTNSVEQVRQILLFCKGPVIVDLESLNDKTGEIFSMCERKIVLGSVSPWRFEEYMKYINKKIHKKYDTKSISFLARGISSKAKRRFNEYFEGVLLPIPYVENPFLLSEDDIVKISNILAAERSMGKKRLLLSN